MYKEQAWKDGMEQGLEQGLEKANQLTLLLLNSGRLEDVKLAANDMAFQKKLFEEFKL